VLQLTEFVAPIANMPRVLLPVADPCVEGGVDSATPTAVLVHEE